MLLGVASGLFLTIVAILVVTAFNNPSYADSGFVRAKCYAQALSYLTDGVLAPDDEIFFRDSFGHPTSDPRTITLTLPGRKRV